MKLKLVGIRRIERIPFKGYLYDITSLPHHNLLANNILIHNCEGSMGRRIQKGWKEIPIRVNDKTKTLKLDLEVQTIDGLSGHSDKNQLINYVHRLRSKPERIIFCHGDNTKPVNMARTLHKLFRAETLAPKNLEAVRLR